MHANNALHSMLRMSLTADTAVLPLVSSDSALASAFVVLAR